MMFTIVRQRPSAGFLSSALLIASLCLSSSAVLAAGGGGGGGGGGGISTSAPVGKPKSPEKIAAKAYKAGLRHKARAWRYEDKAAAATKESKRDSLLSKAKREYNKARDKHALALQIQPRNHEAANELGYALRKGGNFKKAIGAYNYALELKPDFLQAIEYRAEAYLSLGFLDDTKAAYMQLFREDEALAAQLMAAIDRWLAAQPEDDANAQDLARWAADRQRLVTFTADPNQQSDWR